MNIPRNPEWLTISRNMRKCENILQLQGIKNLVLNYKNQKKQDYAELLLLYIEREGELSVSFDDIDTLNHKRLSA